MKTKIALALILTLIIVASTFVILSETQTVSAKKHKEPSNHYDSFTLTVTGQAVDPKTDEPVSINLDIIGSLKGNSKCVLVLFVRGGEIIVDGYHPFSVEKGRCIVIEKLGYADLVLHVSSPYGGRDAVWVLKGEVGDLSDDSMSIDLYASKVVLPVPGYPKLRSLSLQDGTLSLFE